MATSRCHDACCTNRSPHLLEVDPGPHLVPQPQLAWDTPMGTHRARVEHHTTPPSAPLAPTPSTAATNSLTHHRGPPACAPCSGCCSRSRQTWPQGTEPHRRRGSSWWPGQARPRRQPDVCEWRVGWSGARGGGVAQPATHSSAPPTVTAPPAPPHAPPLPLPLLLPGTGSCIMLMMTSHGFTTCDDEVGVAWFIATAAWRRGGGEGGTGGHGVSSRL